MNCDRCRLLEEELRIREQSQIPTVPRGAQKQIDRLRAALKEIAEPEITAAMTRAEIWSAAERAFVMQKIARDALA
jgi:hypothetical protein